MKLDLYNYYKYHIFLLEIKVVINDINTAKIVVKYNDSLFIFSLNK
ncbi:hypothetical protein SDC9_178778 [bioreactor metagenome]|uniref:Uncharacterized protein n=1 Tax=bioreactor metagenome TaxID=1076179 RepID=A0A645H4N2_9ZZZZ